MEIVEEPCGIVSWVAGKWVIENGYLKWHMKVYGGVREPTVDSQRDHRGQQHLQQCGGTQETYEIHSEL